jgi:MFS family permease
VTSINFYIQYISIPIINFYEYLNAAYSIPILGLAAVGVASTVAFVYRELTTTQPLIDFHMFRTNVMFASTNFATLFIYTAHYSTLIVLSFYLELIRGVDPLTAGLILTVEPLSVTIFSIVGGWIADRTGSRDPAIAGLGISAAALLLLATTSQGSSAFAVAFLIGMLGAGVGIFAPNNTNANLGSVPPKDRALANGILGMMRHTGQALSLALGTALIGYYIFTGSPANGGTFTPSRYISAMDLNFVLGAVLAMIGAYFAYRGREAAGARREIA